MFYWMDDEESALTGVSLLHNERTDCGYYISEQLMIGYHSSYESALKYAKIMHPDKHPKMCPQCLNFLAEMKRIKTQCQQNRAQHVD